MRGTACSSVLGRQTKTSWLWYWCVLYAYEEYYHNVNSWDLLLGISSHPIRRIYQDSVLFFIMLLLLLSFLHGIALSSTTSYLAGWKDNTAQVPINTYCKPLYSNCGFRPTITSILVRRLPYWALHILFSTLLILTITSFTNSASLYWTAEQYNGRLHKAHDSVGTWSMDPAFDVRNVPQISASCRLSNYDCSVSIS